MNPERTNSHLRPCHLFAPAVLLCLAVTTAALAGGNPPGQDPGVEPSWKRLATSTGLDIRLVDKKNLKRNHSVYSEGEGYFWLEGVLAVEIRNRSSETITFENFDAHNLVFVDVKTGQGFTLVHSCACVSLCEPGGQAASFSRKAVKLVPGQLETVTFEEFGCSGSMWEPPPEGVYDLYYRVRPYSESPVPLACPSPMNVKTTVDSCKALLESDDFWQGAWSSIPLRVDLRKTHQRKP